MRHIEDPYLQIYNPDVVPHHKKTGRRTSRGSGGLIRQRIRSHASQWVGITLDGSNSGGNDGDFIDNNVDDSPMNNV